VTACRGCDRPLGAPFLDLGETPLANAFVHPRDAARAEPRYPLAVARCEGCGLVQLERTVPPEALFSRYAYFSSYSTSFVEHARRMAGDFARAYGIGPGRRVLEIASNDGYLLGPLSERGATVLGIEPAENVAEVARAKGIPTLVRFFGEAVVPQIREALGPADLIVGNNVLAHVPDVRGFLRAVRACLSPTGVAVFEVPHLAELLARAEFDTIYHEHVFYFSLGALRSLFDAASLEVFDVEQSAVHGGSIRVHAGAPGARPVSGAVSDLLRDEDAAGLSTAEPYVELARAVDRIRRDLRALLEDLKARGKRIAAYGAPAKGNTLLSFCGIDRGSIDFTVDRSPHKQGLLLPGSRIPILPPDALLERMPDATLVLPWNLEREIVGQQAAYLARGGRMIVPIPRPRFIEAEPAS